MPQRHPVWCRLRSSEYGDWRARFGRACARAGFVVLALCSGLSTAAQAQATNFSGAVALTSELVDRGQAITRETPILQGAASWTSATGWSLGLSGGAELHSPGHVVETLAQISRHWSISGDWQMQAELLYYRYSGSPRARAYDRTETGLHWSYRDVLTLGVSAIYVNGARNPGPRGAADLTFHWPLRQHFSVSAGAGMAQSQSGPYRRNHYAHTYYRQRSQIRLHGYGHLGLSWSDGPWRVDVVRLFADSAARRQWDAVGASPWIGTVSRSF
ncbi:MAG TPA: hypothetical protein VIL60_12905 [Rhodanobacter sp.]